MSEKRTVKEIQHQYAELCTRAGHIQYQIHALSRDLDLVNDTLREINLEAFEAQKVEDEAKKSEESSS